MAVKKYCYTPEELTALIERPHRFVTRKSTSQPRIPKPKTESKTKVNYIPWVIVGGLGILFYLKQRTAPIVLPAAPGSPPPIPPAPPPLPPPAKLPVAVWSGNNKTLNTLEGYHRAKQSEVNRESEILSAAQTAVTHEAGHRYGDLVFGKTTSGVSYAIAIEEHTNHPPKPNLGASIFIKNVGVA